MQEEIDMEDVARAAGYQFDHKGCPCNGLPYYYRKTAKDGGNLELVLYRKRGVYKLFKNNSKAASGTDNTLTETLKIWD